MDPMSFLRMASRAPLLRLTLYSKIKLYYRRFTWYAFMLRRGNNFSNAMYHQIRFDTIPVDMD